jgi:hypothetical protein
MHGQHRRSYSLIFVFVNLITLDYRMAEECMTPFCLLHAMHHAFCSLVLFCRHQCFTLSTPGLHLFIGPQVQQPQDKNPYTMNAWSERAEDLACSKYTRRISFVLFLEAVKKISHRAREMRREMAHISQRINLYAAVLMSCG